MRSGGVRRRAAAVAVVAIAVLLASCGHSDKTASTTTFTTPHETAAPPLTTTVPPTSTTQARPPRPWRTGFANGTMPLQDSNADLAKDLAGMAATGAHWFRIDFYWATVQDGGPNSWNWDSTDRVVKAAVARGLDVLALPAYSPTWARPPGTIDHHPPLDPDAFARFVYEAAKRYAPLGVHTWEIWNEPNVSVFWPPLPDPEAYTQLLRRAYAAIKSADSGAFVLSGGLAAGGDRSDGDTISARTFLRRMYDAGAKGSFDAVALHPSSFPAMPLDPHDWNTFYNTPTLYQVMVDHGDGRKRIWATEYGAPTGRSRTSVTAALQRDLLVAGYRDWLRWPFTGPLLWYSWRDLQVNPFDQEANFGLVMHDGTRKPALQAFDDIVTQLQRAGGP